MPAHAEVVAAFGTALRGGPLPPGVTARDPAEVGRRMAVYSNTGTVTLTEALAARFPVIVRLVGAEFFAALARAYLRADPPVSPVLAEWGGGFPAYLDGFAPLAAWPWMGDVARIEVARGQAFHAADAAPVDPARLAGADPARARLVLHPSVRLLRLAHPAVSVWARHQPGGEGLPPGTGPETALVLRDPAFAVPVRAVGPGDAALVAALLAGRTLMQAAGAAQDAAPGHDPQPLLVALMRDGAVTDVVA